MKNYFAKINKGFIVLTLLCCVMLLSCGESVIDISLNDLAGVIGEKIDLSNTVEYSDTIKNELGINDGNSVQLVVLKEMDVNSSEILILVEAPDKDKAKEIEEKLKSYKTNKLNELRDYTANPDNETQYYLVEDSEIIVEQQYVFLAVNNKSKEINEIIKKYVKDNTTKS